MPQRKDILLQLTSDDPEIIREAAYAAGEQGTDEAIALLVTHLQSHNLGVQEAADTALRKIGGSQTVQAIIPLLRSDDAPVRNLAMDILRAVGDQDFPALARLLHDNDPDIRIFATDILGSARNRMAVQPLCDALLKDPEVNVRYQAAVSLGDLQFKEAAACLNKALADEEWVQFAVIEALTKIRDESSLNALVKAMDKATDLVCSMIIEALGEMGNIKAVNLLLRRLDTSATALRNKIVKAIVSILGGKSLTLLSEAEREKLRQYLLIALQDEDEDIQDAAIQGSAFVGGAQASTAVLELTMQLDPVRDQERLERIVGCLATIGLNDSLTGVVLDGDWKQAMVAVKALTRIGNPAAIPLLTEAFWSRDQELQREVAFSLASFAGPESQEFFMRILREHNDATVMKTAVEFLGEKLHCAAAGGIIFGLLEHPYDDVKEAALDACVAIGGEQMQVRFKELFHSAEAIDRLMATYALGKLGVHENIEEIKLALEDEVPDIRKVAVEALRSMCLDVEGEMALIMPRLTDENREVRLAVVELLGGCEAAEVTPYLLQALDDGDDWVRIRALEALSDRREHDAVQPLITMLDNPNKLIVLKVVEALGRIGGHMAFRALLDVLNTDDVELQAAAEEAVARIQDEQGEAE